MLESEMMGELRKLAERALGAGGEDAEKLYVEMIEKLDRALAGNQKEIAAALAGLARQIEGDGRADDAFTLKQRTCEVMLKVAMSRRRGGHTPPRQEPAEQPAQTLTVRTPFRSLYFKD